MTTKKKTVMKPVVKKTVAKVEVKKVKPKTVSVQGGGESKTPTSSEYDAKGV